jgi:hypothetical protein
VKYYGVRRQAKRDAALELGHAGTESTKAPSPLRSSKKLTLQLSNLK